MVAENSGKIGAVARGNSREGATLIGFGDHEVARRLGDELSNCVAPRFSLANISQQSVNRCNSPCTDE